MNIIIFPACVREKMNNIIVFWLQTWLISVTYLFHLDVIFPVNLSSSEDLYPAYDKSFLINTFPDVYVYETILQNPSPKEFTKWLPQK